LLALAGVLEVGKAHLAHGRLGSGGQAIFAYPGLVRRFPRPAATPFVMLADNPSFRNAHHKTVDKQRFI
jgi:hypothetical protein